MSIALHQLDTSVRLPLFAVGNLLLLIWTYKVVARAKEGWSRFFWSFPLLVVCYLMSALFYYDNPAERSMTMPVALNYLWLCPWKILAFSTNRGCLQKALESGSLSTFAAALLANVNVAFEVKRRVAEKKDDDAIPETKGAFYAHDDVRFSVVKYKGRALFKELLRIVIRICLKVVVRLFTCYFYVHEEIPFIKDVVFLWHIYSWGSKLKDVSQIIILMVLNIKLEDSFDHPYLSDSFSDFWSRRWNRIMSAQLRDLCYEPIVDGRLIAHRVYFAKREKPVSRRLIGISLTFTASALIFWVVFERVNPTNQIPVRLMGLFFLNALLVGLEAVLRSFIRRSESFSSFAKSIPKALRILLVHVSLLTMGRFLFLPHLRASGFAKRAIERSIDLLKTLSIL